MREFLNILVTNMLNDLSSDNIDSSSFVDLLGLRGKRFNNASLDGIVISVYDFVCAIWRSERLYKFVDHGIDHSFNVLKRALEIFERVKIDNHDLSPYEKTILGIGSLIHDIGMQYEKYKIYNEDLIASQIRNSHVQIGYDMIQMTINGDFQKKYGGPDLAFQKHHTSFLYEGALVGFSHSGNKYWDKLKESYYSCDTQAGQYRRLRLLAGLLRLGDELHCEFTRIPELNFLDSSLLDDEGKAHWSACHYTQDIKLASPGPGGVRFRMYWRVPEDAHDSEIEEILTLLQELREKKNKQ